MRFSSHVAAGRRTGGDGDFVAPWYRKAAEFMADNPAIKTAFVSTNSITQGEAAGRRWTLYIMRVRLGAYLREVLPKDKGEDPQKPVTL